MRKSTSLRDISEIVDERFLGGKNMRRCDKKVERNGFRAGLITNKRVPLRPSRLGRRVGGSSSQSHAYGAYSYLTFMTRNGDIVKVGRRQNYSSNLRRACSKSA